MLLKFATSIGGNDGSYGAQYHAVAYSNQVEFLVGVAARSSHLESNAVTGQSYWRRFAVGVQAGLPFTTAFVTDEFTKVTYNPSGAIANTFTASRHYLVGPVLEVRLLRDVSLEADALYGPLSLAQFGDVHGLIQPPSIGTFHAWQFPVIAKYKFRGRVAKPYLEAGPTFRRVSSGLRPYLSSEGLTGGVGLEATITHVHIAPCVRFVHWGNDSAEAGPLEQSKRNQAQFLLSLY